MNEMFDDILKTCIDVVNFKNRIMYFKENKHLMTIEQIKEFENETFNIALNEIKKINLGALKFKYNTKQTHKTLVKEFKLN